MSDSKSVLLVVVLSEKSISSKPYFLALSFVTAKSENSDIFTTEFKKFCNLKTAGLSKFKSPAKSTPEVVVEKNSSISILSDSSLTNFWSCSGLFTWFCDCLSCWFLNISLASAFILEVAFSSSNSFCDFSAFFISSSWYLILDCRFLAKSVEALICFLRLSILESSNSILSKLLFIISLNSYKSLAKSGCNFDIFGLFLTKSVHFVGFNEIPGYSLLAIFTRESIFDSRDCIVFSILEIKFLKESIKELTCSNCNSKSNWSSINWSTKDFSDSKSTSSYFLVYSICDSKSCFCCSSCVILFSNSLFWLESSFSLLNNFCTSTLFLPFLVTKVDLEDNLFWSSSISISVCNSESSTEDINFLVFSNSCSFSFIKFCIKSQRLKVCSSSKFRFILFIFSWILACLALNSASVSRVLTYFNLPLLIFLKSDLDSTCVWTEPFLSLYTNSTDFFAGLYCILPFTTLSLFSLDFENS